MDESWFLVSGQASNLYNNIIIESVSTGKDLGVWTDDKLKFSSHISHVVSKANQVLGLIEIFCV